MVLPALVRSGKSNCAPAVNPAMKIDNGLVLLVQPMCGFGVKCYLAAFVGSAQAPLPCNCLVAMLPQSLPVVVALLRLKTYQKPCSLYIKVCASPVTKLMGVISVACIPGRWWQHSLCGMTHQADSPFLRLLFARLFLPTFGQGTLIVTRKSSRYGAG